MIWTFWVMATALAGIYAWSLYISPVLRSPGSLVIYTVLMILHAALRRRTILETDLPLHYFILQGALVVSLSGLAKDHLVVLALALMLISEAALLIEDLRRSAFVIMGILGVYSFGIGLIWGWDELPTGLAVILPLALFLGAISRIANRQDSAHKRSLVFEAEIDGTHLRTPGTQEPSTLPLYSDAPQSLPEALLNEVNHFRANTRIHCTLDLCPLPELQEPTRDCILQTVANSLSNVEKYADASEVSIRLGRSADWVEVEVLDNGIGFDPLLVSDPIQHYSLLGMQERALLAGGSLEVVSKPGEGTRMRLRLPIMREG